MSYFMDVVEGRRARVLLYGHINLNVIDGSAFFLTALADLLSIDPLIEVDLALAVPLTRTLVIEDVLGRDNVSLLDPFADSGQEPTLPRGRLSHERAATYLAAQMMAVDHDIAFIRSTEVAAKLATLAEHLMPRVVLYVTGIVSPSQSVPDDTVTDLQRIVAAGARIACQTPEMAAHIANTVLGGETGGNDVVVMAPVVRAVSGEFAEVFQAKKKYTRFVYTGKFFRDWIPHRIIGGFKRAQLTRPSITLDVAGDQFREDPDNPEFVAVTRYLLERTKGLTWHGGVPREASRALIGSCDVGVSWRSNTLDDSLELSTKLLEFGVLGKPCIMNRTPMHERLFGSEYPLFANTSEEFVAAMRRCVDDPSVVERAAQKAFKVSMEYTMDEAFGRLVRILPGLKNPLDELPDCRTVTICLDEADGAYSEVVAALAGSRLVSHRFTGPMLELQLASDADSRQDQSLDVVRALFERRCRMTGLRRPMLEEQGIQLDVPRGLTSGSPVAAGPVGVSATQSREIHALQTQLRKADHTNAELLRVNATQSREIPGLQTQLRNADHANAELAGANQALRGDLAARDRSLNALSESKLGKLQLAYWRIRRHRRA